MFDGRFDTVDASKKDQYIKKYLPEYIRSRKETSIFYDLLKQLKQGLVSDIRGLDNLPKGEKLFISRHNTGDDIWKLMVSLDEKIHIVGAENIHWKDKLLFGIKQKAMKQLEMLPIRESFSQAVIDDKQNFLTRIPLLERGAHKKILNQDKNAMIGNLKYIRGIVSTLLDGQNVQIFVDGPWTRIEDDPRYIYLGYGLIAKQYQRINKQPLPIIPVVFDKKSVIIKQPFSIGNNESKEIIQKIATEKLNSINL